MGMKIDQSVFSWTRENRKGNCKNYFRAKKYEARFCSVSSNSDKLGKSLDEILGCSNSGVIIDSEDNLKQIILKQSRM